MFFSLLQQYLLDAIAPIECLHCGHANDWCCASCQKKLNDSQAIIINDYTVNINKIVCAFNYQNTLVQELIHACKYDGIQKAITPLALVLSNSLKINLINKQKYVLIPVPLHPKRQRERGFNQSQIIAEVIARELNLPILSTARIINTPHQVGLNSEQRQKNMRNVFRMAVELRHCLGSTAIIIDDVITTGATVKSLADVIRPYFKNIYAAALAKE